MSGRCCSPTSNLRCPWRTPAVAEWPVIGPALFEVWDRAHEDLVSAVKQMQPQLIAGGKVVFGAVANTVLTLLLFLVALVLAGFMMGNASQGEHQMRRVLGTIADHERGEELHALVVATVRSVSNGVVGVAFLQALALGDRVFGLRHSLGRVCSHSRFC